jgi:hypothetical protein
MANVKVMAGVKITFAMPDGLKITWRSESDTDTSHLMDTIARFENAADIPVLDHTNGSQ